MKGLRVVDRTKYFPFNILMIMLLIISTVINIHLYSELQNEKNKSYWISGNEYKQIVTEIERLEKSSLGVK